MRQSDPMTRKPRLPHNALAHRRFGVTRPAANRLGMTLVETLLALTIGALLLCACASAFRAGLNGYSENIARGQMLNMGRDFLSDVAQDVRMSDAHGPYDTQPSIQAGENSDFCSGTIPGYPTPGPGGSGTIGIVMIKTHPDSRDPSAAPNNPVTLTYWFDKTKRLILCSRQSGSAAPTPATVVCKGVQDARMYMQSVYVPYDPQTCAAAGWALRRVTFKLSLINQDSNGQPVFPGNPKVTMDMTNAAAPRRTFLVN